MARMYVHVHVLHVVAVYNVHVYIFTVSMRRGLSLLIEGLDRSSANSDRRFFYKFRLRYTHLHVHVATNPSLGTDPCKMQWRWDCCVSKKSCLTSSDGTSMEHL